jgi:hypothetical protein
VRIAVYAYAKWASIPTPNTGSSAGPTVVSARVNDSQTNPPGFTNTSAAKTTGSRNRATRTVGVSHRSRPAYTNTKTTQSVGIDPPMATPICCQSSCDPRVENPSWTPYDPAQPAAASNSPINRTDPRSFRCSQIRAATSTDTAAAPSASAEYAVGSQASNAPVTGCQNIYATIAISGL